MPVEVRMIYGVAMLVVYPMSSQGTLLTSFKVYLHCEMLIVQGGGKDEDQK
jgi:hypothetical protein